MSEDLGEVSAYFSYLEIHFIDYDPLARLCVWERHQGHLLNCVDTAGDSLTGLVMVTHNILVTASGASLLVWDVRLAQPVKIVRLGGGLDTAARVTSVRQCGDTLICAVDNMIKLVKFPILTQKID